MERLDIQPTSTIGSLVAQRPGLARFLESQGVDYCCGGKIPVAEVCQKKGWDTDSFIGQLQEAAARAGDDVVDAAAMPLTALADHIEHTHHAYLKSELPRLKFITEKVANAHGERDPRLVTIRNVFAEFARDLSMHMMKEEQVLFPFIRQLDESQSSPSFHCGSLGNPIRQMEAEHHDAGDALEQFRALTDDYTVPAEACNTYRVMLDSLVHLERDMHQHVHKEDNVLFPRVIERENELAAVAT